MEETVDESPDTPTLESPFAGMTLRLAWLILATCIVALVGLFGPRWLGLAVLGAVFLPMFLYKSVVDLPAMLLFIFALSFGLSLRKSWPFLRLALAGIAEECVILFTAVNLLKWLL